jgi:hypothetical protein
MSWTLSSAGILQGFALNREWPWQLDIVPLREFWQKPTGRLCEHRVTSRSRLALSCRQVLTRAMGSRSWVTSFQCRSRPPKWHQSLFFTCNALRFAHTRLIAHASFLPYCTLQLCLACLCNFEGPFGLIWLFGKRLSNARWRDYLEWRRRCCRRAYRL